MRFVLPAVLRGLGGGGVGGGDVWAVDGEMWDNMLYCSFCQCISCLNKTISLYLASH